jgi:hypothetical protein
LLKIKFVLNLHPHSSIIGLWCNGNTTVFGAVFLGSSPSRPTKQSQLHSWDFLFLGREVYPDSASVSGSPSRPTKQSQLRSWDFLYLWITSIKKASTIGKGFFVTLRSWLDFKSNNRTIGMIY